jgi:hypothetical protein
MRPEVGGQRSDVGSQRSEVGSRKSEVRGQRSDGQRSDGRVGAAFSRENRCRSLPAVSLAGSEQGLMIVDL